MRILIFVFIVIQITGISSAFAQQETDSAMVQYDSSSIELRTIPAEKLDAYRADSDFDYGQDVAEGVSIWDRIRYWIFRLWQTIFGDSLSGDIIEFVFYVLCLIGLVYVILKLLDVNATKLFYRKEKSEGLKFQDTIHDNIHNINFEEEIGKALQESDYRKAIRLRYLFALKLLADEQLVNWQPGKTSAQYLQEVPPAIEPALSDLNYYYIYTWYGNFPAHEGLYKHVEQTFYRLEKNALAKV